jgi:predicted PurR-regulated permease PerM
VPPDPPTPLLTDDPPRRTELRRVRFLLTLIAVVAVVGALHLARALFIPIALAFFFAMLLAPAVNRLHQWRVPRVLACGLVMAVMLGSMIVVVDATIDPAREWLERAPGVLREVERKLVPLRKVAVKIDEVAAHAERMAEGGATAPPETTTRVAAAPRSNGLLLQTPVAMIAIAGTFFLTFFLLAWGPLLLSRLAGGSKDPRAERALQILDSAQRETAQYLGTVTIINIGLGLATAAVTAAFGLPTPFLWGVLAATLNFIPYAGSAVTLCVVTIVALFTQEGIGPAVGVALSYLGLATLEGQLVQPLAVGRRLALNPLLVFLALWFGGWLWGVAGMVLATPMLLAAKAVSCEIEGLEHFARVLGPPPEPSRVHNVAERLRRKPSTTQG